MLEERRNATEIARRSTNSAAMHKCTDLVTVAVRKGHVLSNHSDFRQEMIIVEEYPVRDPYIGTHVFFRLLSREL
jgi:hypothetical protein